MSPFGLQRRDKLSSFGLTQFQGHRARLAEWLDFSLLGQVHAVRTTLGKEPMLCESWPCHGPTVEEDRSRAGSTTGPLLGGCSYPGPTLVLANYPTRAAWCKAGGPQRAGLGCPRRDQAHLSPGERVPGIVHDTVKIVGLPQGLHLLDLHLQEVILLPCEDQEKGVGSRRGQVCVGCRMGKGVLPVLERCPPT